MGAPMGNDNAKGKHKIATHKAMKSASKMRAIIEKRAGGKIKWKPAQKKKK